MHANARCGLTWLRKKIKFSKFWKSIFSCSFSESTSKNKQFNSKHDHKDFLNPPIGLIWILSLKIEFPSSRRIGCFLPKIVKITISTRFLFGRNQYSNRVLKPKCWNFMTICLAVLPRGGGGALVFEVGYHPLKNVIRVVFQDQEMYARTSFTGAKTCKIGKKGVFLVI